MSVHAQLGLIGPAGTPPDAEVFWQSYFETVPRVGTYVAVGPAGPGSRWKRVFTPGPDDLYVVRWQCWLASGSPDGGTPQCGVLIGVERA
jgi:hypothetical protein